MAKLLGAVLLVLGGGLLGIGLTEYAGHRIRALNEVSAGLLLLEQELELGGLSLGAVLNRLAAETGGAARSLFSACEAELRKSDRDRFPLLWERAVSACPELGEEGIRLLLPLGSSLGRCGGEEQARAVELVRNRLEELCRRTEACQPVRNRLCRTLGLSGGAFAAILLL